MKPSNDVKGPEILSAVRCESYDEKSLFDALKRLLAPLGGLETFVKKGNRVLLKPNMLSAKNPAEAVTTHPAIVAFMAKECIRIGASVFIGDSPPLAIGKIEEYWEKTGLRKVAAECGATLISFEKDPRRELSIPGPQGDVRIHVSEWYFKTDVVINLPKFKTHNATIITGAVKNHFGLLPGVQKPMMHKQFPRPHDFGAVLAEIAAAIPSHLSIMDGIEGMDGLGPAGGRVIPTNLLLASRDPVAIDLALCRIAGIDPRTIPVFTWLSGKKGRHLELDRYDCRGVPISDLKFNGFQVPPTRYLIGALPDSMIKIVQRLIWARPLIEDEACIRCGACARVCPAHAVKNSKTSFNILNSKCISCFCCMEVCPKNAIGIQSSALISMVISARKFYRYIRGKKD